MFVRVDGQSIFFDVVGSKLGLDHDRMSEKLTFIVLHGGPGFDHSGLRPGFDQFSDIAQVIYLDHRGNGRSVASDPRSWTLKQWGDDIFAFCNALGIEKPVVLGQSFGGMVAQAYATQHPGHAKALILSSTAARIDLDASVELIGHKGDAEALEIARRFWNVGDDDSFAAYMRVCMPLYNMKTPADGANSRARAIVRPEVFRHFSLPGREIRTMDFRKSLARVTCPVLVLSGAEDPITPPHLADEIFESLQPGIGTRRCYANCGHGPFRDEPALVYDDIRRFLASL